MKTYEQKLKKWVDDQPADRKFNYCDIHNCLLCTFFRETEALEVQAAGDGVRLKDSAAEQFWHFDDELRFAILKGCEDITKLKTLLAKREHARVFGTK